MTAKRVDANQAEIVAALRAVGATVQLLHTVGHGCPDLLVGYRRANFLLEVKRPRGITTPDEWRWLADWSGQACVVCSIDDALAAIGALCYSTTAIAAALEANGPPPERPQSSQRGDAQAVLAVGRGERSDAP